MAYVIGAAAGHLTPMYPTHRKDADILASHKLMADLRNYMVSATGYDEKRRLREAVAKVQKAINAGQSEPPAPFRDPFVYVSDDRVRTVLDGRQPEPLNVNVDELQSASRCIMLHRVLVQSRSRSSRAEKEKGRRVKRVVRAIVLPTHNQSQAMCQEKGLARAITLPLRRRKPRLTLGRLQWRLIHLWLNRRRQGARPSAKAKMTPVPKAEPKGKAASVPEAKSAQAPRTESKETKQADPKVEVKKEKVSGDDAPGDSRGSAEGKRRERKSRWDPDEPAKESTKREASKRPDDVDSRPGAAAREASGDDLHSALGRSSAKDAVAPLTASKAMAKKPEGSEVRLQSAERAAASPAEGHFLVSPENSVVDAFLTMSPDRVLNRQVRDLTRNGENASALEVLNQIVANSRLGRTRRDSDVSRTPSRRFVRTLDTRDSRESRRRRYRPRRDEDRDRRRDDVRDRRGDDSLDRERDRRRDDRRRSERDRDRDRARGGRDRRRRDDSR